MSSDRSAEPSGDVGTETYGPEDGILVLDEMTKHFGGLTAVDRLSFRVKEGEILGFIGPNGAGKSTTFNCVTGMLPTSSGRVYFRGEDITNLSAHEVVNRGIGRTFQSFHPLRDRSIVKNVELPLTSGRVFTLKGLRGETHDRAARICEQVGLEDHLHQTPDELPHAGMVRLEIARALATDPDLLLIDEPFAGLANTEIDELSNLFTSLRDDGLTLVTVDHNMRGILTLVDRVVVIQFGEKIAEGTPEEIRNDPTVQEAYLGE